MKLSEIRSEGCDVQAWADKGYELPKFDLEAVRQKTHDEPTWIHFGAGNIFRAFPAALLQRVLDAGAYDRGVIVAEGFDYEIIDKAYRPYDNMSLLVLLKSDGSIEKRVVASVTESLKADPQFGADWDRLVEIFRKPSLQMVSFTITEKGYSVSPADLERGAEPQLIMGKVTALLYERYQAGALPITVQSMDNCSHNGDKVRSAAMAYAETWVKAGLGLGIDVGDPAVLHLDEAAAHIQAAGAPQGTLLIQGDVGGAAADVQVGHRNAPVVGQHIRPRAPAGEYRLQVGSGSGYHKVSRQIGQSGEHLVGVLLPGGLAGDDHRAGLQLLRRDPGRPVLLPHDLLHCLGVDLCGRTQRREIDLAAVDDFLVHNVDPGNRVAAGLVLNGQTAEDQLRGGGTDVDAYTEYDFVQEIHPLSFYHKM